jgi:hypothetical protein
MEVQKVAFFREFVSSSESFEKVLTAIFLENVLFPVVASFRFLTISVFYFVCHLSSFGIFFDLILLFLLLRTVLVCFLWLVQWPSRRGVSIVLAIR